MLAFGVNLTVTKQLLKTTNSLRTKTGKHALITGNFSVQQLFGILEVTTVTYNGNNSAILHT